MGCRNWSHLLVIVTFCLGIFSCGGGEVVKVTTVSQNQLEGIKESDLAKIEALKQAEATESDLDPRLSNVIKETRHFTASEYLAKYPKARGASEGDYKVGGYDVLSITVYEEADLSRDAVRVSEEGYISFPLIGRIRVDGLSTSDIEKLISGKLAEEQYLLDAHVSVMVTEYNSKRFLVLGAVKVPGSYSLMAQERVLDAISKAGGIKAEEAGHKAMIVRTLHLGNTEGEKIVIDIDLQRLLKGKDQIANLYLAHEDALYILPAEHFYIIGQVKKPASYAMPEDQITLVEAIGMAGGFTQIAAKNRTRIIRVEEGEEKVIEVQVDAITKSGKKIQDVIIQPNDVIVVPESFF